MAWHARGAGFDPTSLVMVGGMRSTVVSRGRLEMWCGSGSWSAACRVGLGEVAGDRLRPGAGIALQGPHRGVPGPGQQQRQVGAILGGVGEGRMAQLVQRPPGTNAKQFGGPPVRQPGPPAGRVQVQPGDRAGWPAAARKTGPWVRPASRRGSNWADPVCQNTHSTAPPLLCTWAGRLARSRSATSRASSSLARAAVSYSSRHRVRSRSGRSRRANSRSS